MLRASYLDTLDEAGGPGDDVPAWLGHQLVFGLAHFFHTNDSRPPVGVPIDADERADFHAVVGEMLGRIDVDDVVPYGMGRVPRMARYVLQHGYRDEPWLQPFVLMSDLDDDQHLVKFSYFYTGDDPVEEFRSNGVRTEAVHAKTRHLYYTGRLLMKHRIAWVPFRGMMEVRLDGREMDLALEQPPFPRRRVTQGVAGWFLRPDSSRITGPADKVQPRPAQTREGRKAQRIAARERTRKQVRRRVGADGPAARRGRQRRGDVPAPAPARARGERLVRARGGLTALGQAGPRGLQGPDGRPRLGRVAGADEPCRAPAVLARRPRGDRARGDRGGDAGDVAVHLPPARRDHVRPLQLAQRQEAGRAGHQHQGRVPLDRRRHQPVQRHHPRGGADRHAPLGPAARPLPDLRREQPQPDPGRPDLAQVAAAADRAGQPEAAAGPLRPGVRVLPQLEGAALRRAAGEDGPRPPASRSASCRTPTCSRCSATSTCPPTCSR